MSWSYFIYLCKFNLYFCNMELLVYEYFDRFQRVDGKCYFDFLRVKRFQKVDL